MEVLYIHTEDVHNFDAAQQVLPFIIDRFKPRSMLDVGCGIGTWLKVAKELGVKEITGVDGEYVNRELLKIDQSEFIAKDLRHFFSLDRKYDLVLCLEVAEHLPGEAAPDFVRSLCHHSDVVIFSAAIPNQGGQNHLNEQWPAYWEALFAAQGFKPYDLLRPVFWSNNAVEFWYRQNMIIFSKNDIQALPIISNYNAYVHPQLLQLKLDEIAVQKENLERFKKDPGVKNAFKMLFRSIRSKMS